MDAPSNTINIANGPYASAQNPGSHTHPINTTTTDSGAHDAASASNLGANSLLPPYYTLDAIKNTSGSGSTPNNIIAIWTGTIATIPAGWSVCDGGSGTPNLLDKFIRGSAAQGGYASTGGALTHTHNSGTFGHTHAIMGSKSSHGYSDTFPSSGFSYFTVASPSSTAAGNGHTHTGIWEDTGNPDNGGTASANTAISTDSNVPPYYYVAYIMKTASNTVPTFSVQPVATYAGGATRTGPNTTWGVTFTANDSEQSGAGFTYQIRTSATPTGGTLVASGTLTFGSSLVRTGIAYNASGLVQGSNTLYVHVYDGGLWGVSNSFTVLRDDSVSAPSSISHSPNPVPSDKQYSVTFNAPDTYSTNTNEMTYQIRTAASGGGTLVGSGSFTQGNSRTTSTHTDNDLVDGNNNRYLRVFDGANNVAETLFVVDALLSVSANITGVTATASLGALAGTVTAQVVKNISGVTATANIAGLPGTVTAQMVSTIVGALATLALDALAGVVAAVRVVTVSGTTATLTLSAPAGIVEALRVLERMLTHFRFRNDDGSEATATWAAAEDTDITRAKNITARLRIQVDTAYAEPAAEGMKLQYRKVGDPDWIDMT